MSRRKARAMESLLSVAAALPWWLSATLAVLSFFVLRRLTEYGMGPPSGGEDLSNVIIGQALRSAAQVGQFLLPLLFLLGAAMAIGQRLKRAQLLATYAAPSASDGRVAPAAVPHPGPAHTRALSWREFERLVGEIYRGQGYRIEETERGADGGVDLVLRRGEERYFVQCKQWQGRNVDVKVIRELKAVIAEASAQGGAFVTSGEFTRDAVDFGRSAGIELIGGKQLHMLARRAAEGDERR